MQLPAVKEEMDTDKYALVNLTIFNGFRFRSRYDGMRVLIGVVEVHANGAKFHWKQGRRGSNTTRGLFTDDQLLKAFPGTTFKHIELINATRQNRLREFFDREVGRINDDVFLGWYRLRSK